MSRFTTRAAVGALTTAALVGGSLLVAGAGAAGADPTSEYFMESGSYDWTVPDGVTEVTVEVNGAEGGDGANGAQGGLGGRMTATFPVDPGLVLHLFIGERGATSGAAGFNGGGAAEVSPACSDLAGGSGGGATDVRIEGTALADRVLVAGGGGGGGGAFMNTTDGGAGGGDIPTAAADTGMVDGGQPGGLSAGGTGGNGFDDGADGALGDGGAAGNDGCTSAGGGGGGFYGGGGGGLAAPEEAGGGGGGSAYAIPFLDLTAAENGVHSGDGAVVITYEAVPPTTTTTTTTAPETTTTTAAPAPTTTAAPAATPQCPSPVAPNRIWGNAFSLGVAKFLVDNCGASTRAVIAGGELFWVVDPAAGSTCPSWRAVRVVMNRNSLLIAKHLLDNCRYSVRLQKEGSAGVVYVIPEGHPAGRVTV